MQRRMFIIAILILALTAAATAPRANAEPLTIMAIIGVVTVAAVSSVDMVAHSDDSNNKDMRAQQEETARHACQGGGGHTSLHRGCAEYCNTFGCITLTRGAASIPDKTVSVTVPGLKND